MPTPGSVLFFYVDDGNFCISSDSFATNHWLIKYTAPDIYSSFNMIGCAIEPNKLDQAGYPLTSTHDNPYRASRHNPHPTPLPALTITMGGQTVTLPNSPVLRYLGFYVDTFLNFKFHVNFYTNRAMSTLRALPILGNSVRGVPPVKKCLVYITNVRTIMTYGHMLWHDPRRPKKYLLNHFTKRRRRPPGGL